MRPFFDCFLAKSVLLQFTLFCRETCFVAVYALSVWRQRTAKMLSVEKKWQISCMVIYERNTGKVFFDEKYKIGGGQSHQFSFTSEWSHCPRRLSLQLQRPVAGKSIRFPFFWRQVLDSFKNFLTTDRFQIIGTWFFALERGCKKTWFAFRL